MHTPTFPEHIHTIFAEFIPICRTIAGDRRYAISVGGSLGKGTWDAKSDVDFRLFTDRPVPSMRSEPQAWAACNAAIMRWQEQGVAIDGVWPRTVGEIDAALDAWLGGNPQPVAMVWTIWGYHILPDIANQYVIEDPFGIIAGWSERLRVYPPALKQALLKQHLGSLRYWRNDYHYAHKVERGDVVFLAGISTRLAHDMIQVLFALNEQYFIGDGSNLAYVQRFALQPPDFAGRLHAALYPQGADCWRDQYAALMQLIDDVINLSSGYTS